MWLLFVRPKMAATHWLPSIYIIFFSTFIGRPRNTTNCSYIPFNKTNGRPEKNKIGIDKQKLCVSSRLPFQTGAFANNNHSYKTVSNEHDKNAVLHSLRDQMKKKNNTTRI